MEASRSYDEATAYLLQQDTGFAGVYLHAALAEINRRVESLLFLSVLRQVTLATRVDK